MGYTVLLDAMYNSLALLPLPLWPAAQKRMVEKFVLQGLDIILLTAGIPAHLIAGKERLVDGREAGEERLVDDREGNGPACL